MDPAQLYRDLGCKPVVNAAGNQTVIGGSRPSPAVQEAMDAASRHFVDMKELLLGTGEIIAKLLGAEAAFVTPGCAAALALASAACMSKGDPERMERLPDTTGGRRDFLLQKRQHYHYERCLTVFGGKLVEVGDGRGTTPRQLEDAITDRTAGIHYFASGDEDPGVVDLAEIVPIAQRRGIAVTVDSAYQVYPLDRFTYYARTATLAGFGAKYIGACNSTGILAGRKDFVEAAFMHSFIGFETSGYNTIGRPLKVDRQEVVAVVVALKEWMAMDHAARIAGHWLRADRIIERLKGLRGVTATRHVEDNSLSNGVMLTFDEAIAKKTASATIAELKAGDPAIWTRGQGSRLRIAVAHLLDDEVDLVADRIRRILA